MRKVLLLLTVVATFAVMAAADTTITVVNPPGNAILNGYDTSLNKGSLQNPWIISESVTGAPVYLEFANAAGGSVLGPGNPTNSGHATGRWIYKEVTNNTGVAWTSLEMEVQSIFGQPSGEGDGLSFAQGAGFNFTSGLFPVWTHEDILRDYINFSGATLNPGDTTWFLFAITDNLDNNPFWLKQTPNKSDVPEPATLLLFGSGMLALARKLRKS